MRVGAKSEREESRLVRRKVRHTFSVRLLGFRLDRVELIVINAIGIASALNSLHTVLCLKTETRLRELAMMAGGSQEAVF